MTDCNSSLRLNWRSAFTGPRALVWVLLLVWSNAWAQPEAVDPQAQMDHYHQVIKPVMKQHCYSCHNGVDQKAGLNLEDVFFINAIIGRGPMWQNVIHAIESGEMPPASKPRMTPQEKAAVTVGINEILASALANPDPGPAIMRRLSHREFRYTVMDLVGVDFDARSFFPTDASGGEGFDNQSRVLYVTPLTLERYYEAAELILDQVYKDPKLWRRIVPESYSPSIWERIRIWWHSLWNDDDISTQGAVQAAEKVLYPFTARAYRQFLDDSDQEPLKELFTNVYAGLEGDPDRFDKSILESLKFVLISPRFLYRRENDIPLDQPYRISNFELASRLSYFLWSSAPDQELLDLAYRSELHEPHVLKAQVARMVADPRSKRFAESFASQWLGIEKILDKTPVDPEKFPEFDEVLGRAMYEESVAYFDHVLSGSQNFLDLLDSDYTFLNERLAKHYGIEGVKGDSLVKVQLADRSRGGVLGMGSVLMATSLPTRTSPVLRGKWVLEQLLGTPPPPPPPDIPELEASKEESTTELDLRELLTKHRAPGACFSCHQRMDPLGLGLENFDAVGRWRDAYGTVPIDASGVLTTGEAFAGPAELKTVLLEKKELFARNLSRVMLSYALGRGVQFADKLTVDALTENLIDNNFNTVDFLTAVVTSYPFQYRKRDLPEPPTT